MKYTIRFKNPNLRYIHIEAVLENVNGDIAEIQLPSWRPGRYELGSFAKNVKDFTITNEKGEALPFIKINKDLWQVQTNGSSTLNINYQYYAAVLDAGSSYADYDLLYINPVNCLVYHPETIDEPCGLTLDIPKNFTIGCALPLEGQTLQAENFDQLADSPLMAGPHIEHHTVKVEKATHHLWISGQHTLNIDKFLKGVKQYTLEQVSIFNDFPAKDYHYLLHFLPGFFRHGVEHSYSTVIAIGPGAELANPQKHIDLLAICSHELFHFWNIKRIRPASMWPYDFTKENYSSLGYVYEGITTYYGDYMLLRSGVISFEEYAGEVSKDIQKHFDNAGRYHYSVAESSFDTWLDGYVPGAPGRKISIYIEGMLAALIADVQIRKATAHKSSLDTVMRMLYEQCYKQGRGYSEDDYRAALEETGKVDMEGYFADIIWGRGQIEKYLPGTLHELGLELEILPNPVLYQRYFGFKTAHVNNSLVVSAIAPGSPAETAGLQLGDVIMAANSVMAVTEETLNHIIQHSPDAPLEITARSLYAERVYKLQPGEGYYNIYRLAKTANPTTEQVKFYCEWSKNKF